MVILAVLGGQQRLAQVELLEVEQGGALLIRDLLLGHPVDSGEDGHLGRVHLHLDDRAQLGVAVDTCLEGQLLPVHGQRLAVRAGGDVPQQRVALEVVRAHGKGVFRFTVLVLHQCLPTLYAKHEFPLIVKLQPGKFFLPVLIEIAFTLFIGI